MVLTIILANERVCLGLHTWGRSNLCQTLQTTSRPRLVDSQECPHGWIGTMSLTSREGLHKHMDVNETRETGEEQRNISVRTGNPKNKIHPSCAFQHLKANHRPNANNPFQPMINLERQLPGSRKNWDSEKPNQKKKKKGHWSFNAVPATPDSLHPQ